MKIPIYKKMMFGFIAVIAIMVFATTYILFELHAVTGVARRTMSANVASVDHAKQLKRLLYDEEGYAQKFLITEDKTYFDLLLESGKKFEQIVASLRTLQTDDAKHALINHIVDTHQWLENAFQKKRERTDTSTTNQLGTTWHDQFEQMRQQLDRLISLYQVRIGSAMSKIETTTNHSASIALLITICTLAFAILIASLIARTITKPIADLIEGTDRIAKGDFETIQINSRDEIAQLAHAFNNMTMQLKRINEYKAEMMQEIAHELSNPIQIIRSSHDLLKSQHLGQLTAQQLNLLAALDMSTTRIAEFNHQYLDIAKFDAGMMEYRMEPTDLLKVIEPIVSDARLMAADKEIHINITVQGSLPQVHVDQEKIGVVFRNLLKNALTYSPNRTQIDVLVSTSKFGIRASVSDQGFGIPPEDLPKVFEKFYQAQNACQAKTKGTGLGLALVKAYTEGHGGRVTAQSTVNAGSIFIVELPAAPKKFLRRR